jgi:hypothetical protein
MMNKFPVFLMRHAAVLLVVLSSVQLAQAQYKKVNLFTKSGRIYEIGINSRLQFGERSPSPGIFISVGRSSDEHRTLHWFDIGLNAGNKFDYKTVSSTYGSATPEPMRVKGSSSMDYTINYTFGYYLADNSDQENGFLPFIDLTLGWLTRIKFTEFTQEPSQNAPLVYPADDHSMFTAGVGGGFVYRMNESLGVRVSANFITVTSASNNYNELFEELTHHPAVQVALRFNMNSRN